MSTPPNALALILYKRADDAALLVDPDTGEVVTLADADAALLARVLRQVELDLIQLRDAKRWLGREMITRMDSQARWTVRTRGVEVTAGSPQPKTEWDAEILVPILDELVAEGVIDREASFRACEPRTEWKPLARGIAAISKIPGVNERLAPARRSLAGTRSVKVSVNPGGE